MCKTLKTPRGTFEITTTFDSLEEARKEGYGYYFTFGGKDIYTKSDTTTWHTEFAVVIHSR